MRYRFRQRALLFVALCSLAGYLACAAPKPCTISPVEIEELKSDIRDLDAQLAARKQELAKLEAEVADLTARIEGRRSQVPALQAELTKLKKASGVTEKTEEEKAAGQPASGAGF